MISLRCWLWWHRPRLDRTPAFGTKWDDLRIACHGRDAAIQHAEGCLRVGGHELAYAVQVVRGVDFYDHCCTARVMAASAALSAYG